MYLFRDETRFPRWTRLHHPQTLADHFDYMANMALKVHSILANNSRQTTIEQTERITEWH
jgi:hypothetical protein